VRSQPVLRIVIAAAVVGLFYWALFTGSSPERRSTASSTPDAERTKQLAEESRALIRKGDYAAALGRVQALHDAYPSSPIYIDQLAIVFHHLNRPADEAAMLEEYLVKAPTPGEACPRLGLAYRASGRDDKAFDAFERCLALEPNDPDAILYLALAQERVGRTAEATALYNRGLALVPDYPDLRLGLARIVLRQGQFEKAKSAALAVLEKSPDNTDALLVAGLACLRNGERSEARGYLERGVRLAPESTELAEALAQAQAD